MSKQSVDLLRGDIKSGLLRFALPLFLGQVFQQMYNMVDALVVGNLCGENALAAVTSTGSLIFLIVGFFGGVYGGVGVVIARCYGAGDEHQVKRAVGTAVLGTVISGVFLTLLGVFGSPVLLRWMGTPAEVMGDAVDYLGIYFMGILFVVLYNSATGIFQAIGDSKRPLYYLIVSSVANVVLDILFVGPMGMGVKGAALATVIAQGLSAGLAFFRLSRAQGAWRVTLRGLCLDKPLLREMLRIGLPSGVQNSVIAFANVMVQSSVNVFGAAAMAGNGAFVKLEGFAFIPVNAFGARAPSSRCCSPAAARWPSASCSSSLPRLSSACSENRPRRWPPACCGHISAPPSICFWPAATALPPSAGVPAIPKCPCISCWARGACCASPTSPSSPICSITSRWCMPPIP